MAFAETFKALSDPVRREILQLLKNGKMSAGEIGGHFDMTGATISYHLKILKKADLVWETKIGRHSHHHARDGSREAYHGRARRRGSLPVAITDLFTAVMTRGR